MRIILILFFTSLCFIGSSQEVLSPDEKNGKWGYISSTSNKVIIPHLFDMAKKFKKNGFAEVKKNNSWGTINTKGEIIIPIKYDSIGRTKFFLISGYTVGLDGKFGVVDLNGKIQVPIIFPEPPLYNNRGMIYFKNKNPLTIKAEPFFSDDLKYLNPIFEEFFITKKEGKLGVTNVLKKEVIIPHEYDKIEATSFCNLAYLKVWKNRKVGIISLKNKPLIPIEFIKVYIKPDYNIAAVLKERKWAIMNLDGEYLSDFEYERVAEQLGVELFPAKKNDKWGYINQKGKTIIPFKYDRAAGFSNRNKNGGLIRKKVYYDPCTELSKSSKENLLGQVGLNGSRYLINLEGKLFKDEYKYGRLDNDLKRFENSNGDEGIKTQNGKIILPTKYRSIRELHKGFIYISKGEKQGFFFPTKNKVFLFDMVEVFTGDSLITRWVKTGNDFMVINNKGDFVSNETYERVGVLIEGLRPVTKNGKVGYLNEFGKEKLPFIFDEDFSISFSPFIENRILVVFQNGKYGFINSEGKQLKPFEYDAVPYFRHGIAIVFKNGKWEKISFRK